MKSDTSSLKEAVTAKQELDVIDKYNPSDILSREDEKKLLKLCHKFSNIHNLTGPEKVFYKNNKEKFDNICSCINTSAVLPYYLDKRCNNYGLKLKKKSPDNLVICNSSQSFNKSSNILESNNNMIACNFTDKDINPDAFIYAAKESNFFISPHWLFMILLLIITISVVSFSWDYVYIKTMNLFRYF